MTLHQQILPLASSWRGRLLALLRHADGLRRSPLLMAKPTSPLRLLTSEFVQVFGRRHDEPFHALLRPASKKRQGTKSRDVCGGGAAGAMGILPRVRAC
jgi:hypothetical protein